MEPWSQDDTAFNTHYYNNDGYYSNDGNKLPYDEALVRGWRIDAGGGGDQHSAWIGSDAENLAGDKRIGVLATALTKEAIFDAFRARRFYSTIDKNLELSFEINRQQMGSIISAGHYDVVVNTSDGDGENFTWIELIQGSTNDVWGNLSTTVRWSGTSLNPQVTQNITTESGQYYYVIVHQSDGNEAISSPIFIN
jgi:hypothetical protein